MVTTTDFHIGETVRVTYTKPQFFNAICLVTKIDSQYVWVTGPRGQKWAWGVGDIVHIDPEPVAETPVDAW